jgi:hypothetical protein
MSDAGYLLIFASRLLEVFGFLMALLFIFKGVALKHVFITAGLAVSGILISLFGFVSGKISTIQSFAIESVFAGFNSPWAFMLLRKNGKKSSDLQSHRQRAPDVQYAWALSKRTTTAWHGKERTCTTLTKKST